VVGTDAMGAGLRLLPMIGGLIAGAAVADRLGRLAGAKVTVAVGFALMAAALFAGATTRVHSGTAFTFAWVALLGVGLGFAMPGAMDAALGALSAERSGVGSALIQALRQVGAAIGVAVLGTVLNTGYHGRLDLAGLPAPVAGAVRDSVAAGVAVAHQLGSPALLLSVRAAFVHGMDLLLLVCGGIAVAGVALTVAFLPRRREAAVDATGSELATSAGEQVATR
jgi:MFS transporter, DHA2 family, multidrug resistance protein